MLYPTFLVAACQSGYQAQNNTNWILFDIALTPSIALSLATIAICLHFYAVTDKIVPGF
jgi:hypothetical protein